MRSGIIILLVIVFLSCSTLAQEMEVVSGVSQSDLWISNPNILVQDPVKAFQDNPELAMDTINYNPNLLDSNPKLRELAFKYRAARAATAVNKAVQKTPGLLKKNSDLRKEFGDAAKKDVKILNDNPQAKKEFLKEEHNVDMYDEDTEIRMYDGTKITTKRVMRTTETGTYVDMKTVELTPGYITLTGDSYKQGQLRIASNGNFEFLARPETPEVEEIDIPATDVVTVDTGDKVVRYLGNTIKGHLNFDKGRTYIAELVPQTEAPSETSINGVILNSVDYVDVFFDGEKHEGKYVSMNKDERTILFSVDEESKSSIYAEFEPGNPFIDIIKPEPGVPFRDHLSMEIGPNTDVTVQHREDKIPVVTMNAGFDGGMTFTNGHQKFSSEFSSVKEYSFLYKGIDNSLLGAVSVPFTFLAQDQDGKNIIGRPEREPQKVVFDGSQNFMDIPEKTPEEKYEKKDSKAVYNHYLREQIMSTTNIEKISGSSEEDMIGIIHSLRKIPPKVRNSIRELEVVPASEIEKHCGEKTGGCASGSKIIVPEGFSDGTLYHEAAHTETFQTEIVKPAFEELASYQLYLRQKYGGSFGGKLTTDEQSLLTYLLDQHNREIREENTFKGKWNAIAGPVYGQELGEKVVQQRYAVTWADGTSGPRNGCVEPYGCNSNYEDIATFTVKAEQPLSPIQFLPLIAPPEHPAHVPTQYDPRYRAKLDLLYAQGFISADNYFNIINYVSVNKEPPLRVAVLE